MDLQWRDGDSEARFARYIEESFVCVSALVWQESRDHLLIFTNGLISIECARSIGCFSRVVTVNGWDLDLANRIGHAANAADRGQYAPWRMRHLVYSSLAHILPENLTWSGIAVGRDDRD